MRLPDRRSCGAKELAEFFIYEFKTTKCTTVSACAALPGSPALLGASAEHSCASCLQKRPHEWKNCCLYHQSGSTVEQGELQASILGDESQQCVGSGGKGTLRSRAGCRPCQGLAGQAEALTFTFIAACLPAAPPARVLQPAVATRAPTATQQTRAPTSCR
jgi:hypothetical protein